MPLYTLMAHADWNKLPINTSATGLQSIKIQKKNRNVRDIWGNLVGILKQTGRQLCKSDLHYISNISASKQLTPYHVDVAPTFWGQKVQVCAVKYDLDCALPPIIWIKYAPPPPAPHTP